MSAETIGSKLHDMGLPAWIAIMILGFIVWWPLGLVTLGFLIWSGRMSCHGRSSGHWERKMDRMHEKMERMRGHMHGRGPLWGGSSSGNAAFDEYKAETLRRLEEEQKEFREFLNRLRMSKDRAEFDEFMAERRRRDDSGGQVPQPQG